MKRKSTRHASRKSKHVRRVTRKSGGGKKGNKWSTFVKGVYEEGKRKNSNFTFMDALKEASRLKKAGKF